MKEGAGRREGARSKTWFVLPILFGFGGQKSPRKEFPNDLFGEKITIGGGRMGRGSQGQVAPAPVPVTQPPAERLRQRTSASRRALLSLSFPSWTFSIKKRGYTQKVNLSWERVETAVERGLGKSRPGPQRRLGSCHSSHFKPKKMHS